MDHAGQDETARMAPRPGGLAWPRSAAQLDTIAVLALVALAVYFAITTLSWGLMLDAPVLHYIAARMIAGEHPYRNIFDDNMPVAQWIHYAVVRFSGPSDLAWRLTDLAALASICAILFVQISRYSRVAAGLAAGLVALFHFSSGAEAMGQRDFFATVPLALAALFYDAATPGNTRRGWLFFAAGIMFGLASGIKPTFLLAELGLLLHLFLHEGRTRAAFVGAAALLAGSAAVGLLVGAQLAASGALWDFLVIQTRFVAGVYSHVHSPFRWTYLSRELIFTAPLALGLAGFLTGIGPEGRRTGEVFGILAVTGVLSYAIQGKFFYYQLYPGIIFTIATCATGLASMRHGHVPYVRPAARIIGVVASIAVVAFLIAKRPELFAPAHWQRSKAVASIAEDLAALGPDGATVQPLDVADGSLHAMLLAGSHSPTRFIQIYVFFLPDRTGYVQSLRQELLSGLADKGYPPVILYPAASTRLAAWNPAMANTKVSVWWPELADFLQAHYRLQVRRDVETGTPEGHREYEIYVRR